MDFSLREKLEQAAEQRRIAAGLPPSRRPTLTEAPAPPPPAPEPALPDSERALADLLIDLRDPSSILEYHSDPQPAADEPVPGVFATSAAGVPGAPAPIPTLPVWQGGAQRAAAKAPPRPDLPPPPAPRQPAAPITRCRQCGGETRLEVFDLVGTVAHHRCRDCGFRFAENHPLR